MIENIFQLSESIRYVAIYKNGRLESKAKPSAVGVSSAESDRYEELLVNPTLLTRTSQRGGIDCGGLDYVVVCPWTGCTRRPTQLRSGVHRHGLSMKVSSLFCMLAFMALLGCQPASRAPMRPTAVPAAAVWAGGADGGAWFLCVPARGRTDTWDCTVYNDQTGEVAKSGQFAFRDVHWDEATNKPTYLAARNPPAMLKFSAFDGENIYLEGGHVLLPVESLAQ